MDSFEDVTLSKIFHSVVDWHFSKNYNDEIVRTCKGLVGATLDVYKSSTFSFLPIPSKCHYTFSLRDFSRVIRGTLLIPPTHLTNGDKLIKLWVHETYRVFHDRLIDDSDRQTFFKIVKESCHRNFRTPLEKVLVDIISRDDKVFTNDDIRNLFFGNFMSYEVDNKIYDEVSHISIICLKVSKFIALRLLVVKR